MELEVIEAKTVFPQTMILEPKRVLSPFEKNSLIVLGLSDIFPLR